MLQQIDLLNSDLGELVENVKRSLVVIRSGGRGIGAGSIWHASGLIITNAHVASQGNLEVSLPCGTDLPARVLAMDKEQDIAVLDVDAQDLPAVELGDSRNLAAGQWVMALGHPLGVQGAVSRGVVIGIGPGAGPDLPEAPGEGREWIAASLSLRPGHSGGPLVDAQGRLVGINTVMAGPQVGLAIPVHVVKKFLKEHLGAKPPQYALSPQAFSREG